MKYYSDLLEEVQDFAHGNLGEKFVITKGRLKGETVTIVGYTGQDGLGVPSIIVELPDTLPMGNRGWSPEGGPRLDDRMLLDAVPAKSYWYVDIEDLEEC